MADVARGSTFTDGVPNDCTAAKLNNLVDASVIQPAFISAKTALTQAQLDSLDETVVNDVSVGALRKVTVANFRSPGTPEQLGKVSGSDFTTTSTSLVDITGLTVACLANTLYEVDAMCRLLTSADANGMSFGLHYSGAGSPAVCVLIFCTSSAVAVMGSEAKAAMDSASGPWMTFAGGVGMFLVRGWFLAGSGAGNLTLRVLKATSGTATVRVGSFIRARVMG
jgi:hypothetical protein